MVLPRGRLLRRQCETERLAETAPGEPHIEVTGLDRFSVDAGGIARSFDAVEPPVDQAAETARPFQAPKFETNSLTR